MTIRLLANVANDPKGAVLDVSEDRAKRLIRTGYAAEWVKPKVREKAKEKES
jgi:hypothetical protein